MNASRASLRRWMAYAAAPALLAVGLVAVRVLDQPKPVEVVRVARGSLCESVRGPGTVQAHIAITVSTQLTGLLTATYVDQGDSVHKGELLASLDDRDLVARVDAARMAVDAARANVLAAESAVAKAKAEFELARANQERELRLYEAEVLAEAALDASTAALRAAESGERTASATLAAAEAQIRSAEEELRYSRALLSRTRITASIDGIITAREAEAGDTVVPGSPIFEMVDPRTLWVAARIDETLVGKLQPGQPAEIRLRSGARMAGTVARITHRSDPTTRELEVDVAFAEPLERLVINEEAEVTIAVSEVTGLVVPASALLPGDASPGVLVLRNGQAERQSVTTGPSDGNEVVVEEGLEPGDLVLRDPQGIRPGQAVRPLNLAGS